MTRTRERGADVKNLGYTYILYIYTCQENDQIFSYRQRIGLPGNATRHNLYYCYFTHLHTLSTRRLERGPADIIVSPSQNFQADERECVWQLTINLTKKTGECICRVSVFIRDGDNSLWYIKSERETTKRFALGMRVISVFCVSLIISPASYNGHHVAGCFAVDWMKLIKLKGRGKEGSHRVVGDGVVEGGREGEGRGEGRVKGGVLELRMKGWYLFNVACAPHAVRSVSSTLCHGTEISRTFVRSSYIYSYCIALKYLIGEQWTACELLAIELSRLSSLRV